MVKLHQILSFKYLGFSLEEIKCQLLDLDSVDEVTKALTQQITAIRNQISDLEAALKTTELLREEVISTRIVNFEEYASIIAVLRANHAGGWAWKHFDPELRRHIQARYEAKPEAGMELYETYQKLLDETLVLSQTGVLPESEAGRKMAAKWWEMVMEFTGGDMKLLPQLESFNDSKGNWHNDIANKQKEIDDFLNQALSSYLEDMKGD